MESNMYLALCSYPQGTRVAKGNTVPCSPESCRLSGDSGSGHKGTRVAKGNTVPRSPESCRLSGDSGSGHNPY